MEKINIIKLINSRLNKYNHLVKKKIIHYEDIKSDETLKKADLAKT